MPLQGAHHLRKLATSRRSPPQAACGSKLQIYNYTHSLQFNTAPMLCTAKNRHNVGKVSFCNIDRPTIPLLGTYFFSPLTPHRAPTIQKMKKKCRPTLQLARRFVYVPCVPGARTGNSAPTSSGKLHQLGRSGATALRRKLAPAPTRGRRRRGP